MTPSWLTGLHWCTCTCSYRATDACVMLTYACVKATDLLEITVYIYMYMCMYIHVHVRHTCRSQLPRLQTAREVEMVVKSRNAQHVFL